MEKVEGRLKAIETAKSLVGLDRLVSSLVALDESVSVGIMEANLEKGMKFVGFREFEIKRNKNGGIVELGNGRMGHSDQNIMMSGYSGSRTKRAIIRKVDQKSYLEVYDLSKGFVFCSSALEAIHDSPTETPSLSRGGIIWSRNEERLLYLAGRKEVLKDYGENIGTEEDASQVFEKYAWKQDCGERAQLEPVVVVWDVRTKKSAVVDLNQKGIVPSFPMFLDSEGKSILFSGFLFKNFKEGIFGCLNYSSALFKLAVSFAEKEPKNGKEETSKAQEHPELKQISPKHHRICFAPFIDLHGEYIYYFSRENIPRKENFYVALSRIPVGDPKPPESESGEPKENGGVEEIYPLIKEQKGPSEFNGFVTSQMSFRNIKWVNERQFVVSVDTRCSQEIFLFDVQEKKWQLLSTPSDSSSEWGILEVYKGSLFATRKTIEGQSLMVYDFIQKNWVELEVKLRPYSLKINGLCEGRFGSFVESTKKTIEGFYIYSDASDHPPLEKRPMLIGLHGGPSLNAKILDLWIFKNYLVRKGFIFTSINYSGSTGYGEDFMMNLNGKLSEIDTVEVEEWLRAFISSKKAGSLENLWLFGGSYGGFLSLRLLTHGSLKYKGAAIRNPVTDLITLSRITDIPSWVPNNCLNKDDLRDMTDEDCKLLFRISTTQNWEKIKGKVLLFLGMSDKRAPAKQTLPLYNQMKSKGRKNMRLRVYEKGFHALEGTPFQEIDMYAEMISWLFKEVLPEEL